MQCLLFEDELKYNEDKHIPPNFKTRDGKRMHSLEFSKEPNGDLLLASRIELPRPRNEVFEFFQDAANLQLLTPSFLSFNILSPLPIEMKVGAIIDYRISLYGMPMGWKTEITKWNPPFEFEDTQRKGPYSLWRHHHIFEEVGSNTAVIDKVYYRVFGGALPHCLFVKSNLQKIFTFRQQAMQKMFAISESDHVSKL